MRDKREKKYKKETKNRIFKVNTFHTQQFPITAYTLINRFKHMPLKYYNIKLLYLAPRVQKTYLKKMISAYIYIIISFLIYNNALTISTSLLGFAPQPTYTYFCAYLLKWSFYLAIGIIHNYL